MAKKTLKSMLTPDDLTSFMQKAYSYAQLYSDDINTQNGAVLIFPAKNGVYGSVSGTNCFPDGVEVTEERLASENKLDYMIHAEQNAICRAASMGVQTKGAILVCPWCACSKCAQMIIDSGIDAVFAHKQMHDREPERWRKSTAIGHQMFKEAGVFYVQLDIHDLAGGKLTNLFNGEVWHP